VPHLLRLSRPPLRQLGIHLVPLPSQPSEVRVLLGNLLPQRIALRLGLSVDGVPEILIARPQLVEVGFGGLERCLKVVGAIGVGRQLVQVDLEEW
jgi:hypothetical protein